MAIDIKRFSGVMNSDDRETDILPPQHIHSLNGRFFGGQSGLTFQNVKGNYVIANSSLPSGTNECIGAFYDQVRRRIIWFNYNSNGDHGIYQVLVQTGAVTSIFICGTNSTDDIFTFSLNYPVHSAAIVYRTTGDGDLLYWTDGYNRPRYLNLDTVSALSPFTESMINAAKNAPLRTFEPQYQDDTNIDTNNLNGKLFRFIYRWVYQNGEKSTWSPISKVALPVNGYNPNNQNDPSINNNILVSVIGGGEDYQAIEIAGQESIGNGWTDFFLIDTLDRDEYSINPGAFYFYYFYNNGSYPPIAPDSTDLYFSWLPDKANTLELLNGNVIVYGGITDGYDQLQRSDIDVTIATSNTNPNVPFISWAYAGANVFTLLVGPVAVAGTTYNISFDYVSGTFGDSSPKSVSYVTLGGDTQATIAAALDAALTGNNIEVDNLGAGYLRVKTAGFLPGSSITNVATSTTLAGNTPSQAAWLWGSQYRFGLIYFDERGKTNGVISFVGDNSLDENDFVIDTDLFSTSSNVVQAPLITASINHLPPSWATRYQWVRTRNLTVNNFIHYVTNDYQDPGDGYLYFCIQNLIYQQSVSTGFVPSYEFSKGDRLKVMAAYNSATNFYTAYNIQLDFEIVGTRELTMTSPAVTGTFLKVVKPSTLPSVAYGANNFIQIYTPALRSGEGRELYYEWGQEYAIYEYSAGVFYHAGDLSNQTPTQPATFEWYDGDFYLKERTWYLNDGSNVTKTTYMMDANYSDYFTSAVNSNGRGWVIDLNAKEEYNSVLVRWGGKYQSGTNLNELNIFRPNDFDEVDRSKGDIRRFKARDRILRVFQDRGVGQYGIYARFIQNNEGQSDLVTTNEIITTNNIQYYAGQYGLAGYPTNLCSSPIADYFNDVVTGREIRLSSDGITDLGLLYKGQYYLSSLATPYNKALVRANGSTAKVMKFWDSYENQSHTVLQAGTGGGLTAAGYNYSFNEIRNGFCSFYSFEPEWAISADDIVYSWKNGQLYKHDVSGANYCNFYGTQYACSITVVFNPNVGFKKAWQSIAEVATGTWEATQIYTDVNTYGSQRQESTLVEQEFTVLEGMPSAAFKRDSYSPGGKWNGNFLKGNLIVVKLQKTNASNLINLAELYLRYIDSPLNVQ